MFRRVGRLFFHLWKRVDIGPTHSVIGKDVTLEGVLSFHGTLHLEGRLLGTIRSRGVLYLGKGSMVEADVEVSSMVVMGRFIGAVRASSCVELRDTASFSGVIEAPRMIIDPKAVFEGDFRSTASLAKEFLSSQGAL